MPKSVFEQIRELDVQKAELLKGARAEALQKVKSAIDELNSLGGSYRLVEGRGRTTERKGARRMDSSRPCPICKFQTDPPHDARGHRGQANKKPFNVRDLDARGMTKLG